MVLFEEISRLCSEENNQFNQRKLLEKEGTAKIVETSNLMKKDKVTRRYKYCRSHTDINIIHGTVPYLGTFLTDLTMLHTLLPDFISKKDFEINANGKIENTTKNIRHDKIPNISDELNTHTHLINFDKKRKEFDILIQMKIFQASASNYNIHPDHKFWKWFEKCIHFDYFKKFYRNINDDKINYKDYILDRHSMLQSFEKTANLESLKKFKHSSQAAFDGSICVKSDKNLYLHQQNINISNCTNKCKDIKSEKSIKNCIASDDIKITNLNKRSTNLVFDDFSYISKAVEDIYSKGIHKNDNENDDVEAAAPIYVCSSLNSNSTNSKNNGATIDTVHDSGVESLSHFNESDYHHDPSINNHFLTDCHQSLVPKTRYTDRDSPELINPKADDSCIIKIYLDKSFGNKYKSNLYKSLWINNSDKTTDVIIKALLKYDLNEDVNNFELCQTDILKSQKLSSTGPYKKMIPNEFTLPKDANVYYGMHETKEIIFKIVRKSQAQKDVKLKKFGLINYITTSNARKYKDPSKCQNKIKLLNESRSINFIKTQSELNSERQRRWLNANVLDILN
ncbi:unnamed protein product [Gordionus sp. m RMFG-2023]